MTKFSNFFLRKKTSVSEKKEFSIEEVKHFLEFEIQLFKYNPETLKIIQEIIDIAQKDIKSIMIPRPNIIALDENFRLSELKKIIIEKEVTEIPVYRDNLDNITGVIDTDKLIAALIKGSPEEINLKDIASKPIFISEYSSLNYVLREFRHRQLNMAVILDEYGVTIGILTLNDVFREMFQEIEIEKGPIKRINKNTFVIVGIMPVDEINTLLNLELPERKDYTSVSGLFIYHYGKFPHKKNGPALCLCFPSIGSKNLHAPATFSIQ